jgi:Zn-dependent protease
MFSRKEIKDLFISVIVLSLAFSSFNLEALPVTIFIVLAVFISHEMSHKFLAQHYGFSAEYRMWTFGLLLGLISAVLPGGIMFAAPGAVYITPYRREFAFRVARLTKKQHGLINLAGPLTNIMIGIALVLISFYFPLELFILTARVSFFLALFNLIPIPPLDGSKVISWNSKLWALAFALSLIGLLI